MPSSLVLSRSVALGCCCATLGLGFGLGLSLRFLPRLCRLLGVIPLPSSSSPPPSPSAGVPSLKVLSKKDAASLDPWGFRPNITSGPNTCALHGQWLSKANGVLSGLWSCSPGSFDVVDRENTESVYILQGKVRLTDLKKEEGDEGRSRVLERGDAAVLECGSSVRWEIM